MLQDMKAIEAMRTISRADALGDETADRQATVFVDGGRGDIYIRFANGQSILLDPSMIVQVWDGQVE